MSVKSVEPTPNGYTVFQYVPQLLQKYLSLSLILNDSAFFYT